MTAPIPIAQVVASFDPALVAAQRWFRHKGRHAEHFEVVDGWPVMREGSLYGWWTVIRVPYTGGSALYQIPVVLTDHEDPELATLGRIETNGRRVFICDGACDPTLVSDLIGRIRRGTMFPLKKGTILPETFDLTDLGAAQVEPVGSDSSNTLCRLDDALLFKLYRCLDEAGRREADLLSALVRQGIDHIPAVKAVVTYGGDDGRMWALALVQEWVSDGVDAWHWTTEYLAQGPAPADEEIERMAEAVAAIHGGLARIGSRPWNEDDTKALKDRIRDQISRIREMEGPEIDPLLDADLGAALLRTRNIRVPAGGMVCPVHGDLHLGQMLRRRERYLVLDFEGEPLSSPDSRLSWHSPLKDVAGMLRSFDYAAAYARRQGAPEPKTAWDAWVRRAERVFLASYYRGLAGGGVNPADRAPLLALYLLEKATYEIAYELQSRPDWLDIPHGGLQRVLVQTGAQR